MKIPLAIVSFSLFAIALLIWLIYFAQFEGVKDPQALNFLSPLNALLNTISTLFIGIGIYQIKVKKNQIRHRASMTLALLSSTFFLISYIIYHRFHGDTPFLAEGPIRYVYFFILISHILLSVPTLPLVLLSAYYAFSDQIGTHRKLARITAPLWFYVSVTGVLVFIFLQVFNPDE